LVAHRIQGLAQEAISRSGVSTVRQHKGDQPTVLFYCAKEIFPAIANRHIGLIHPHEPAHVP
jgi:hypothetical protein